MRALIFAAGFSAIVPHALGQCGMAVTSLVVSESCASYNTPTMTMAWSGGTSPFTVHLLTGGGWTTQTTVGSGFFNGTFNHSEFDYQVAVTITDATGCVATTSTQWPNHFPMPPQVNLTQDCAQGATLRWTGKYSTGANTSQTSACPGPYVYTIHNINTGAEYGGTIVNDWVQESPTSWRYSGSLPAGSYWVYILPQNGTISSCSSGLFVECFQTATIGVTTSPGDCGANLSIRAALQGALPSGTIMDDTLRVHNLLPTTEPYAALGYAYTAYTGTTSIPAAMLLTTGNNAIVDWVVVELRNNSNSAQVLFSHPALLQRDGDVMDLDGDGYVNFPNASGSYYVALRHRNHLGLMTSSAMALSTSPITVNFQSASTACYGTTPRAQVGTVMCLWAGDGNGNGTIGYTGSNNDRDPILIAIGGSTPNNALNNVYDRRDINMDGVVRYTGANNDRDIILTNVGSTTPNNTRAQQLP